MDHIWKVCIIPTLSSCFTLLIVLILFPSWFAIRFPWLVLRQASTGKGCGAQSCDAEGNCEDQCENVCSHGTAGDRFTLPEIEDEEGGRRTFLHVYT